MKIVVIGGTGRIGRLVAKLRKAGCAWLQLRPGLASTPLPAPVSGMDLPMQTSSSIASNARSSDGNEPADFFGTAGRDLVAAEAGFLKRVDRFSIRRSPMSASVNPRGIDHVGLTVPDLEAATRFFEQAIGAIPLYDVQTLDAPPMGGADAETQLGLPPGAKVVQMRLLRVGQGASLELFQFADAPQRGAAALPDYGLQHFALYVDDIEGAADRFQAAGGELLSSPNPLLGAEAAPRNLWLYGRTPWGSLIELITYPDGVRVPASSPGRWTPAD